VTPSVLSAGVGAVIVTFNSADTVGRTLRSVVDAGVDRIVVVDNGSTDGTTELVERLAVGGLELLRSPRNLGFGAGCNAGASALPAMATRVLFLNPDAALEGGALDRLSVHLDAHPSCALVAPRMRDERGPLTSAGRRPTLRSELRSSWPRSLHRFLPLRNLPPDYAISGPVDTVEGACMLVDRAAFVDVGGFDERFFLFFEEVDLARRLQERGRTADLCADAWCDHVVGGSRASVPHAGRAAYVRSTVRYLEKWHGRLATATFQITSWLSWTARIWTRRIDAAEGRAWRAALRARP
jgi:GT2 family glycosyltransferase